MVISGKLNGIEYEVRVHEGIVIYGDYLGWNKEERRLDSDYKDFVMVYPNDAFLCMKTRSGLRSSLQIDRNDALKVRDASRRLRGES